MSDIDINDALLHDPFQGDYGPNDLRILSDKLVKGRAETLCHLCMDKTIKGTTHRVRAETSTEGFAQYRWCYDCTFAMAQDVNGNDYAIEQRYNIQFQNKGRLLHVRGDKK